MTFSNLHALLNQVRLDGAPRLDAGAVDEVIPIRVSGESLAKLVTHVEEGLRVYDQHAVIGPWMRTLPDKLFVSGDEAARRRNGIHRVELGHIHDGINRTKRVGYAAVAHHDGRAALVLFVHHSASEANIKTPHGELNSWAELIVGSWQWAWQARRLRFLRDDRMNRSNAVWVRINDAVKARPGALYYLADIEIDPHRDGWFALITGQKSSEEVEVGKVRRLAGQLTKLTSGAWPRPHVPVGLRLGRVEDERGQLRPDKGAGLEVDPDQVDELTAVLEQFATGVSKARIAVQQARRGARNGRGYLLLPQIVPLLDDETRTEVREGRAALVDDGTISDEERRRVEAALDERSNPTGRVKATSAGVTYVDRILAARRHLRSGVLEVITIGAIPGRTDYFGWRPTFVTTTPGARNWEQTISEGDLGSDHPYWTLDEQRQRNAQTHGFWHTPLELGTPVPLDESTWEAIEERIRRERDKLERRTATGLQRPLGGLKWEIGEGTCSLGQGGEREYYRITAPDGTHLHTVNATHAAHALGQLLLDLADRVDTAPLPLHQPPTDTAETRSRAIRDRIDALNKELSQVEEQIKGLMRDRANLDITDRKYRLISGEIDALDRRADELEQTQLPALHAKLQLGADADPSVADTETVSADFAHLTVVGLALLRCDPLGPAPVHDAVSWLLDHGRGLSNLRAGEHDRQILLDVQARVPLADGTVGWLEAGTLDLTDRRVSTSRKHETVDDLARRLLRDDTSLDDLTERYGWPADDILVLAADWLAMHTELNRYVRSAVVTAAAASGGLPVGPVVYAHASGDTALLDRVRGDVGDWIVTQIEQAYLARKASWARNSGWVRNPLAVARIAMASIAQDGPARRQSLVATVDGLRNDEQLKDLLHPGRRSFWQPPLQLDDGWATAHRCRHPTCPGGGDAPMTGFLAVPELVITGDAVHCRYCWRTLTSEEILPDTYRQPWDVSTHTSALRRADGIPTLGEPPAPPARGVNVLRTRDVAGELGIPLYQVQRLVDDGLIPASRNAGGKLVFDADRALSPAIRSRFSSAGQVQDSSYATPRLTIQRAATHLNTTSTIVRLLARYDALANVGGSGAALYDRDDLDQLLDDIRRQTGRATATFAELATRSELASTWEVTTSVVRRLLAHDVLDGVTVGRLLLIDRASIDRLDEREQRVLDPQVRLSADQVAARADLSPSTVLHHHHHGPLPAVRLIPDGRVWFLPEEVDQWLASRTSSTS